jgi:hypothetical protein
MFALAGLGIATAALTWATLQAAHALPAAHARHLALFVAAGVTWAVSVVALRKIACTRGQLVLVFAVAVAMRVPAWLGAPVHSDDMNRYLWDGHVQRAGINPYRYAPDAPELAPIRDRVWERVNNPGVPTIYPPLAQLAFLISPTVGVWKAIAALADLAVAAVLFWWLRRRGGDRRLALVWGWSPLATVELGLNAHVDGLGIALLVAALAVNELGRRGWAGALLGAAAAVKLVGVGALPGLRSRRAAIAFVVTGVALAAPFLSAGPRIAGSLGEYGRRWRGNDGAFAIAYAVAERAVMHTRYRARLDLRDERRWARFITGRPRDTVFPDEAANFFARLATLVVFAVVLALAWLARVPPIAFCTVALGGWLLLTPTLHPWYVLWVVPLVAVGASPAWLVLAMLSPLGYEPLGRWLSGGAWQDPIWTRALEHGLTWIVLIASLIPRQRPLLSLAR